MSRAAAVGLAVGVTVTVALLYEGYTGGLSRATLPAIAGFYLITAGIITAFAVWTAGELGLASLLVLAPLNAARRWRRWIVYGVGVGLLLSAGSVLLAGDAGGALRPWFWQRIQTPLGTALFAARAAVLEETFFRLFMIPFLVSVWTRAGRPRYRLALENGSARAVRQRQAPGSIAIGAAVLVSSLLFGLAHPYNPLPAMLLGPLLAASYLRGGWESAVTAHFLANVVVFWLYF